MNENETKCIILNPIYHLELEEDVFVIYNKEEENIGNITMHTKLLIDELNKKKPLEEICNKFSVEINMSYDYVKRNMVKTIQYLLANQILIEV